jgi:hypothetical protein
MLDIFFWALESILLFGPYVMIKTGELILRYLSIGYYCPEQYKTPDTSDENDLVRTIKNPCFWVGMIFWSCLGVYLSFYLSEN